MNLLNVIDVIEKRLVLKQLRNQWEYYNMQSRTSNLISDFLVYKYSDCN